jgi:hypothetical protein
MEIRMAISNFELISGMDVLGMDCGRAGVSSAVAEIMAEDHGEP